MNFLGRIKNLWSLGRTKLALAGLILVGCIITIYAIIPYPYILDAGDSDSPHKVTFSAPFTVHFSQNMSKGSVEKNFKILPKIEGEFTWPDGKTLEFRPAQNLTIGDGYRLIIDEDARNFFGKKIGTETTLRFIVTGPPYVKFAAPSFQIGGRMDEPIDGRIDGQMEESEQSVQPPSNDSPSTISQPSNNSHSTVPQSSNNSPSTVQRPVVSSNQIITVMFDRPMEWGTVDKLLITDPEVKGEYRFLGMSAFQFIPEAWPSGKDIKLTVPSGVTSRDGGKTEEEFVWSIQTEPLRVTGSTPETGEEKTKTDAIIQVRFNQPVELDKIRPGSNALLYPSNDIDADKNPKMDGFFNTEVTYAKDELGQTDKTTLQFKPSFPYLPGVEYKFVLKAEAYGLEDIVGMKNDFEIVFKTAAEQGVASFTGPTEEWPSIFLKFNTAMTAEEIRKNIVITPDPLTAIGVILDPDNKQAEITCQLEPKQEYEVLFKTGAKDAAGNVINTDFKSTFTAPEASVKLRWETAGEKEFFMSGIDPEFSVTSKNTGKLSLELCMVTENNFIETDRSSGWEKYKCYSEPYTVKVSSRENQTTLLNLTALFKREWESGIYYFSVTEDSGRKIWKVFLISDTSLVFKRSPDSALVWATDIATGEPVSRMELEFTGSDGTEIARGVTDGDGVYTVTKNLGEGVYVIGKKTVEGENRWAIASEYWTDNTQNPSEWFYPGESRVYTSVDSNVAYLGGEVKIKGLWRIDNDAQLTLPEKKEVLINLEDESQNPVISEKIPLRRDGSFDTTFALPLNLPSGTYTLCAYSDGEKISSNGTVISIFRSRPPFNMEWIKPQEDFTSGSATFFKLRASYSTGIPAASLRGKWELYSKPYYFGFHPQDAYFSYGKAEDILCWKGGCPDKEELVSEGEFTFDRDGIADIVLSGGDNQDLSPNREYTLRVFASDANGTQTSKGFSFKVHPEEYYLGMSLKHSILEFGSEAEGLLMLLSKNGDYVQNRRVVLSLVHMENGSEGKVWHEKIITTGSSPQEFAIPISDKMPAGIYKLKAKMQDSGAFAEFYAYVTSENGDRTSDGFAIYSDQAEYFVGGKALLLLNHPSASAENPINVLVTYERGGILGYKMVELSSPITRVEIPVIKEMAPNIHIQAMVIGTDKEGVKNFMETQEKRRAESEKMKTEVDIILLEDELKSLQESDIPDTEKIKEMQDKIEQLKSETGPSAENIAPVSPDVIKPDIKTAYTDILVNMRDREILLDVSADSGDDGKVKLKIHSYDYQNRPIQSVVTLNAVQNDSNQISPALTPFSYFFRPRGSQVSSASNMSLSENGSISNNPAAFVDISPVVSTDESGYFNPALVTDENGYAETEFDLSGGYGNWNIIASATSGAEKFGIKTLPLSFKKSLYVHPVMPAFAVQGDKMKLGATLKNTSDGNIETRIELVMEGAEIKSEPVKNLTVKSGETTEVDWDIEIKNTSLESIKATFKTNEGDLEVAIPVTRPPIYESVAESGILDVEWSGKIRIPKEAVAGIGGLSVAVSGTPASIVRMYAKELGGESFSDIDRYAGMLFADSILQSTETDRDVKSKLDEDINRLAESILASQSASGGFAYWEEAEESPWLTAYVLLALQKAGVTGESIKSAASYLWNVVNETTEMSVSEKIFILWALSESGEYDTEATVNIFQSRTEASVTDNALILSIFNNLYKAGQKSVYPYIERLKSEIMDMKMTEDDLIFFEDDSRAGKSTAAVLMALNSLDEKSPEADSIFKYLISRKSAGAYRGDQLENALLILALSEYKPEESGTATQCGIKIRVNGKTLAEGQLGDSMIAGYLSMDSLNKGDKENEISIEKDCEIPLYFSADAEYSPENQSVSPIEEDILVTRGYYALEDYSMKRPLTTTQSGVLYRGVLTLIVPQGLSDIMMEEPLPAGVKALYINPDTADLQAKFEQEKNLSLAGLNWPENPIWNFDKYLIEDARIILSANYLPAGVYTVDYIVQAGIKGSYNHLPATVKQISDPSVYSRTEGGWMRIE
jgi:uncharacterized protein YfaS (alpha-2-macroglobulin family)